MGYLRFDPVREFENVSKFMEKVAKDFGEGIKVETGAFRPRVDILERKDNYSVQIELPGMKKEEVSIAVNDERVLTVKGNKISKTQDGVKILRNERLYGEFSRSLHLPETTDIDNISAVFENGTLTLDIPKKAPVKPKEIEISIN